MMNHASPTMAWTDGKILPLNELRVPATDCSLEHGLGLFESMRAKQCQVPLWGLHRGRLTKSAAELNMRLDIKHLPTEDDFRNLIVTSGLEHADARLRLTLTGGSGQSPGRVWVAVYPLGPSKVDNLILAKEFWPVDERDPLVAYKTMNYWARRRAFEQAQAQGADEALSVGFKGQIWEAARSSLFLVRNQQIIAPQEHGSRLRSVSEAALVDLLCTQHTLKLVYQEISPDQLAIADEVILTNAVRGLMSVGQWHNCQYPSPGPVASELRKLWQANYF